MEFSLNALVCKLSNYVAVLGFEAVGGRLDLQQCLNSEEMGLESIHWQSLRHLSHSSHSCQTRVIRSAFFVSILLID